MPIAITAEQSELGDAVRRWADGAGPLELVRAQEHDPGRWRDCWRGIAGLGAFGIALPEAAGGAGGSVADLAVLIEAAAGRLAPGPITPTALAGLLLARSTSPVAREALPRVADGTLPVAVALCTGAAGLRPGAVTATVRGEELELDGDAGVLLGADPSTALLLPAERSGEQVWLLLEPGTAGVKLSQASATDFSRSLAEVHLGGVRVPGERVLHGIDADLVRDLAATLFAAEAAGVADWALRTAVGYAKVREQFGRPIGSFQAVKHMCAELLCRLEQATALAWDAATAADDDAQRPVAAATAGAVVFDAAVENAKDCIQVLGGIGFTWEHDAHLYLRRAVALRAALGGTGRWQRRLAELTLAGARRELRADLGEIGPLRAEVRASVERVAALPADERRAGLVGEGLLTPHWPAPYGRDAAPAEQLVIDQELARAGVTRPDLVIAGWAIPTILRHGTPAQRERFVRPTLLGEVVWCQLFSEPGAGSDLASLRTRADRVEGGWQLSGQKVWTSEAHRADWAICLARTDPDAPRRGAKHSGIGYFLVDMHSPGIEIRPLREITGEALFNEVFLDGVFVPDELVVGDPDEGWKLARTTLVNERVAMGGTSSIGDAVERLLALAVGRGRAGEPAVLERLGALIAGGLAGSTLELRATLKQLAGGDVGAESSVRKLVGVRHRQAVAEAALDLLGSAGLLDSEQLHQFLMTRCLTIAGGTSQVLLTLAAERILGLPRG